MEYLSVRSNTGLARGLRYRLPLTRRKKPPRDHRAAPSALGRGITPRSARGPGMTLTSSPNTWANTRPPPPGDLKIRNGLLSIVVFQPQPAPHRRQTPLLRAVCSGPRPAKLCGQPSWGLAICCAPDVLLVPWALRFRVRGTRIVLASLLALMRRFGPSLPGRPGYPSGEEKERAARGITLLTPCQATGQRPTD